MWVIRWTNLHIEILKSKLFGEEKLGTIILWAKFSGTLWWMGATSQISKKLIGMVKIKR